MLEALRDIGAVLNSICMYILLNTELKKIWSHQTDLKEIESKHLQNKLLNFF